MKALLATIPVAFLVSCTQSGSDSISNGLLPFSKIKNSSNLSTATLPTEEMMQADPSWHKMSPNIPSDASYVYYSGAVPAGTRYMSWSILRDPKTQKFETRRGEAAHGYGVLEFLSVEPDKMGFAALWDTPVLESVKGYWVNGRLVQDQHTRRKTREQAIARRNGNLQELGKRAAPVLAVAGATAALTGKAMDSLASNNGATGKTGTHPFVYSIKNKDLQYLALAEKTRSKDTAYYVENADLKFLALALASNSRDEALRIQDKDLQHVALACIRDDKSRAYYVTDKNWQLVALTEITGETQYAYSIENNDDLKNLALAFIQ